MSNKNRPVVGIINTLQADGDNVFTETATQQWCICDLNTDDPISNIGEPIPYGKTLKVESFAAVVEVQQIVVIGGENKETIAVDTRYKLQINNPERKYESYTAGPSIHAYSTGAAIPAADAARTLVYSALVDKVNAYSGNNVSALLLFEKAYTLGGATGNETPIVGETALETTSGATARIMSWTITAGTFGAGTAAGSVWMALVTGTLSAVTKTWTYGSSSSTLSGTNAAVLGQGIAIEDDAGYFVSKSGRPGISDVSLTQGFATDVAVVALAGAYALGVGSVMAALKPVYDPSKQDAIYGDLEFDFLRGDAVDPAKFYTKYVVTVKDGDQNAIDFSTVDITKEFIFYVDESNGTNLGTFDTAILAAAIL